MPELPEVETVRRGLEPIMHGAKISRVEQRRADLRFPFYDNFTDVLEGAKILELGRRAKYLLFHLNNKKVLISHLGMSGSFRIVEDHSNYQPGEFLHEKSKNEKHDHVVLHVLNGAKKARIIYNDPRRFGFMILCEQVELNEHPYFKDLGPEPTGNSLSYEYLAERFANRSLPLKSALLDQKIIAGLGNIYVCEALWRSHLSPLRKVGTLVAKNGKPKDQLKTLTDNIRDVISEAIDAGGSSLQDHIQADGSLGYFQHSFAAYGQENKNCRHLRCDGKIARMTQSGRSTFYCPKCQK